MEKSPERMSLAIAQVLASRALAQHWDLDALSRRVGVSAEDVQRLLGHGEGGMMTVLNLANVLGVSFSHVVREALDLPPWFSQIALPREVCAGKHRRAKPGSDRGVTGGDQ